MTPQTLLQHLDSGELWPAAGEADALDDVAVAYQQALAVRALRVARGEQPRGYKIGFTNRSLWQRYAVFAPIWGTVWDTSLSFSDEAGVGVVHLHPSCQPRIEPETVFGMRATPAPQAGLDELFDAIAWVAPGFEIVQSHRPGWKFAAPQAVADGGLHARLLVGPRRPLAQVARDATQLHRLLAGATVSLHQDGTAVEAGAGAAVLDSPLAALLHFVRELRQCPGAPDLLPGDVVTTGTWTDAWPVQPGQTWQARFSAPLSALTVRLR